MKWGMTLTTFSPECRARKIKCDETQPECAQCVRDGRVCRIIDGLFRPHQVYIPRESASRPERPPKRQSSGPQIPVPQTHPEDTLESSVSGMVLMLPVVS